MFSIIIPTLQKDTAVLQLLLNELEESDAVGEILIIDNLGKGLPFSTPKTKTIIPKENLYVNPAWNLGIKESKFELFGILNDDLIFPKNAFNQIHDFLKSHTIGLLGLDSIARSSKNNMVSYPQNSIIRFCPVEIRDNCWGSAIFGCKSNYRHIPQELKIWCGDDYLFNCTQNEGLTNYKMFNLDIKHLHSNTSSLTKFDKIKEQDVTFYQKIDPALFSKINRQKKFETIIPLKNSPYFSKFPKSTVRNFSFFPFSWNEEISFAENIKKFAEYLQTVQTKHPTASGRSKSILFIYTETPTKRQEILYADFLKAKKILTPVFPSSDIHFLYLFCTKEVEPIYKKIHAVDENVTRISFDYGTSEPLHANSENIFQAVGEYIKAPKIFSIKNFMTACFNKTK